MGFALFRPGGSVGRLRCKPGFVDINQLDRAGLRLDDELGYVALGLCEALGIALFFKL